MRREPAKRDTVTDIEAGKIAPVYVLYGEESALISEVIRALRKKVLSPGTETLCHEKFDGRDLEGAGRVLDACAQIPMLGGRRLVELYDPDQIAKGKDKTAKNSPTKQALDALSAYAAAPHETTVLVVTGSGIDGRSRLVKAAAKTGVARKFEPLKRDGDAVGFLMAHARRQKVEIEADAAQAIVAAVGTSQARLMEAFERAELHAGAGRPVRREDVEAVVTHTREEVIFELTDAVGMGDRDRALAVLDGIFQETALAEIGQANMVLAMLTRQIRLVFTAATTKGALEDAAGVPPFVARKLRAQAQGFDERRLRLAYAGLARLDSDLKGGSQVAARSPRLALERWILDVCGGVPGTDPRT
jgi:DNA polymerase-3 subunit delta